MQTAELVAGQALDILIGVNVMDGSVCNYSTDIAAAWELVKELNRRGLYVSIDSDKDGVGSVAVLQPQPAIADDCLSLIHRIETAETVPLAICRAALRAVTPV